MKLKPLRLTLCILIFPFILFASTNSDILELTHDENVPPYVKEVITINLRSHYPPDLRMRQAFWFALTDYAPFTEERVHLIRLALVGPALDLLTLFYEDTLIAITEKTPVKSTSRLELEEALLSMKAISTEKIEKFETLQNTLIKQAQEEKMAGETGTIITGFLDILHKSNVNLELLFIPIPTTGVL